MKKNIIFALILTIITLFSFSNCLIAADPIINLQAEVAPEETLDYVGVELPAVFQGQGKVIPSGDSLEDINSACWQVAGNIIITLNVRSNLSTNKLVIYSRHREQTSGTGAYWNTTNTATLPTNVNINGLINTNVITSTNWYNAVVPMRAYADVWNKGISNTDSDWQWVSDISNQLDQSNAQVLYTGDLNNNALKIYLKTSWAKGKLAGNYKGKIFFALISQ